MALTKVSYSMLQGKIASVFDYGAVGDGIADDSDAIQAAFNSGLTVVVPQATYKITKNITIPSSTIIYFEDCTFDGHFSGWMLTLEFPGLQTFIGTLNLVDNHPSVVSSATVITNGIQFASPGNAIHDFNSSACQINADKLLQAYYISYQSYRNVYGTLSTFRCGNTTTNAFFMDSSGSFYANDSYFTKIQCTGIVDPAWNGAGPLFIGWGITVAQLHCESLYNSNGAQFAFGNINVQGGYFEVVGGTSTSNTVYVSTNCAVTFTGVLVNSPQSYQSPTTLIGCRFLNNAISLYGHYINCEFPNANLLQLNVTLATMDALPRFGTSSKNLPFRTQSGNFSEWGYGYTLSPDYATFGGNRSVVTNLSTWKGVSGLRVSTAAAVFAGSLGFYSPMAGEADPVYAWAIVRPNSSASNIVLGVGGDVTAGVGNFDIDSLSTVTGADVNEWILVVQPLATPFTNAGNYGNNYGMWFTDTSSVVMSFDIAAFGIETGGIGYENLASSMYGVNNYRTNRLSAPPASGQWEVGQIIWNTSPTATGQLGWVCTTTGNPGTWTAITLP
jgi:hypothetical protein